MDIDKLSLFLHLLCHRFEKSIFCLGKGKEKAESLKITAGQRSG